MEATYETYSLATGSSFLLSRFLGDPYVCSKNDAQHVIRMIDVPTDTTEPLDTVDFTDSLSLKKHLDWESKASVAARIFLLHQPNSWRPIKASKDMILALVCHYKMIPGFFDVLTCFQDRILQTEEAFSRPVRMQRTTECSEICYSYKYAEERKTKGGLSGESNPWVIRQTGVYHQYNYQSRRSTYVIINPGPDSKFEKLLEQMLDNATTRERIAANPILLHTMLISAHLPSWRDYLLHYETKLLKTSNIAVSASIDKPQVTSETLSSIRLLETRLLPVDTILSSVQRTNAELGYFCIALSTAGNLDYDYYSILQPVFRNFAEEVCAYRENVGFLLRRANGIVQLISDTLNFKNQALAQEQNLNVIDLTRATKDDSVIIRVITVVTLVYLPFSFIATLMGTNLFSFDQTSHQLVISTQFWIFFAVSVPLTTLTMAFYRWKTRRHRDLNKSAAYLKTESTSSEKMV